MSRQIDMDNLSEEDILYLQERGKRPAGVDPVPVEPAKALPLSERVNTGDVGLQSDQTEDAFNNGGQTTGVVFEDNYEELDVDDLKDEIKRRNEEQEDSELHMAVSGRKAELIDRLREDDRRRYEESEGSGE